MAKNFKELRVKMSPERQKRVEEKAKKMILQNRLQQAMDYMASRGNEYQHSITLTYHEAEILVKLLEKGLKKNS